MTIIIWRWNTVRASVSLTIIPIFRQKSALSQISLVSSCFLPSPSCNSNTQWEVSTSRSVISYKYKRNHIWVYKDRRTLRTVPQISFMTWKIIGLHLMSLGVLLSNNETFSNWFRASYVFLCLLHSWMKFLSSFFHMLFLWCLIKKRKEKNKLAALGKAWRAALANEQERVKRFWLTKQSAFMKYLLCRVSLGAYNVTVCGVWLSKWKSLKEWEFWKQVKKAAWSNVIRQGALEPWGTINKGSGTCCLQSLYLFRERFSNSAHGMCFLFLTWTHCGSEAVWTCCMHP